METEESPPTSSPELDQICRSRSNTFSGGDIGSMIGKAMSKSDGNLLHPSSFCGAYLSGGRERDSDLLTFSSPRHFLRRGGVVSGIDVSGIQRPGEDGECVKVLVEEGKEGRQVTETVLADNKPLRELLDYLFIKNDLEVDWAPPTHHFTVTMRNGTRTTPDLDLPTQHFAGCTVEIRPLTVETRRESKEFSFTTLQSCLSYFSSHGLVELPLSGCGEEEYHLPQVQSLDNIPGTWEDLPIKSEYRKNLSPKQLLQQQALWELIQTEHSHLKNLEVIINLFMRTLELIRRANVLSRDNYHNVFGGYMEELYTVHEQFWGWTLWPCLEQVYLSGKPLDITVIIQRFPEFSTHFEIYEQHCALDSVNIRNLDKAMKNQDFRTYLEWCEAHPQCQRRRLKDFLVIPMQRLTKYPLLFRTILKETEDLSHNQQLEQIWSELDSFVQSVNTVLLAQSETERVRDAMSRITTYTAVDMPGEYRELIQPYTHLDLLAPVPDVEIDKPRVLILEGSLKYRDHTSKMVAHVFLFTDLLLITKVKKGGENFSLERPPYKISSLVLHPLEPGSFLVLVLTQYRVLTTWFTLKAVTEGVATEWMKTITSAQSCYTEAVEKKAHHWKILQGLKSERILNGIECKYLSQNMGSANSHFTRSSLSRGSLTASVESLDQASPNPHTPVFLVGNHSRVLPMSHSRSADVCHKRVSSNPALNQTRSPSIVRGRSDSVTGLPLWLERTSSLNTLFERPETNFSSHSGSMGQLLSPLPSTKFPRVRSQSMDQSISKYHMNQLLHKNSPASHFSDSSESDVNIHEAGVEIPQVVSGPLPTVTSESGKQGSMSDNFSQLRQQSVEEEREREKGEETEREGKRKRERVEGGKREREPLGKINERESENEEKLQPLHRVVSDAKVVIVTPPSPSASLTNHTLPSLHHTVSIKNTSVRSHTASPSPSGKKPHGNSETSPSHKKPQSSSETSPSHKKPHSSCETSPSHKKPHGSHETSPSHKKPHGSRETSPSHKKPHGSHETSPSHKKPHGSRETSPSHKKPHGSCETSPSHKKLHGSSETSPSHKKTHGSRETSPTHMELQGLNTSHKQQEKPSCKSPTNDQSPSHKKPRFEALKMLGGAAVTILASISVKELLEEEEYDLLPSHHTVIPTSGASGSDNESVSSPRTQVVKCIQGTKLGGRYDRGVMDVSGQDLNLKHDTSSVRSSKFNQRESVVKNNQESKQVVRLQSPPSSLSRASPTIKSSISVTSYSTRLPSSPERIRPSQNNFKDKGSETERGKGTGIKQSALPLGTRLASETWRRGSEPVRKNHEDNAATSEVVPTNGAIVVTKPKVTFSEVVHYPSSFKSLSPSARGASSSTTSKHEAKEKSSQGKDESRIPVDSQAVSVQTPFRSPPSSTPPKLSFPRSAEQPHQATNTLRQHRPSSNPRLGHSIPPPQKRITKQSVKELSMLFEGGGKTLEEPSLSFIPKLLNTLGLDTYTGSDDECGRGQRESGRGLDVIGTGMRKSVSTPKLNGDDSKEMASLSSFEQHRPSTDGGQDRKFKSHDRDAEGVKRVRTASPEHMVFSTQSSSLSHRTALTSPSPSSETTSTLAMVAPKKTAELSPRKLNYRKPTEQLGSEQTGHSSNCGTGSELQSATTQQPQLYESDKQVSKRTMVERLNNGQPRCSPDLDRKGPQLLPNSGPLLTKVDHKLPKTGHLLIAKPLHSQVSSFGAIVKPVRGVLKNQLFHANSTSNPAEDHKMLSAVGRLSDPNPHSTIHTRLLHSENRHVSAEPNASALETGSRDVAPPEKTGNVKKQPSGGQGGGGGGAGEEVRTDRKEGRSKKRSIERGRRVKKEDKPRRNTNGNNGGRQQTNKEHKNTNKSRDTSHDVSHDSMGKNSNVSMYTHGNESLSAATTLTSTKHTKPNSVHQPVATVAQSSNSHPTTLDISSEKQQGPQGHHVTTVPYYQLLPSGPDRHGIMRSMC